MTQLRPVASMVHDQADGHKAGRHPIRPRLDDLLDELRDGDFAYRAAADTNMGRLIQSLGLSSSPAEEATR